MVEPPLPAVEPPLPAVEPPPGGPLSSSTPAPLVVPLPSPSVGALPSSPMQPDSTEAMNVAASATA
ncbi:hypothetical protein BE21_15135 [Sorangium cellulosum]|uniref:Uncharacterized protein n=1 Tax=Sorangium cellulosum TaxID=56 RepID=A0A150TZ44_SORCE|nr:hypothetical protein BE21_15135 [Sorangium cellulosum]